MYQQSDAFSHTGRRSFFSVLMGQDPLDQAPAMSSSFLYCDERMGDGCDDVDMVSCTSEDDEADSDIDAVVDTGINHGGSHTTPPRVVSCVSSDSDSGGAERDTGCLQTIVTPPCVASSVPDVGLEDMSIGLHPSKPLNRVTKEDLESLGDVRTALEQSLQFFILRDDALCDVPELSAIFFDKRKDAIGMGARLHGCAILEVGSRNLFGSTVCTPDPYVIKNSVVIWALFIRILDKFLLRGYSSDAIQRSGTFNVWSDIDSTPKDIVLLRSYACMIYLIAWKFHINTYVPSLNYVSACIIDHCRNDDRLQRFTTVLRKNTLKAAEWMILTELDWGVNLDTAPAVIAEILKEYCDNPDYLLLEARAVELSQFVAMNTFHAYHPTTSLVRTSIACVFEAVLALGVDVANELPELFEVHKRLSCVDDGE